MSAVGSPVLHGCPASLGFRMPAEWEEHSATWMVWPHNRDDWEIKTSSAQWCYVEIIRQLVRYERVSLICQNAAVRDRAEVHLARGGVAGGLGESAGGAATVDGIAHHGAAEVLEVHADLVRAAGVQCGFDQRGVIEFFQHAKICVRFAPVGHDGDFFAMHRMARQRLFHRMLWLGGLAAY